MSDNEESQGSNQKAWSGDPIRIVVRPKNGGAPLFEGEFGDPEAFRKFLKEPKEWGSRSSGTFLKNSDGQEARWVATSGRFVGPGGFSPFGDGPKLK